MFSIEDIYKNFGKNIYIYPVNHLVIKGASVDLTASKYAWSIRTKKSIYNEDEQKIIIPPHDTAVIFTNEVLYVTNRIGGTYHSKVSFTAAGLGHIGTTLDPEFIGPSKITIHNHSDTPFSLGENHTLVSVCFFQLDTKVSEKSQPDCQDFISAMIGYEGYEDFKNYIDQRPWMLNPRKLKEKIRNDDSFEEYKKSLVNGHYIRYFIKSCAKQALPVIFSGAILAAIYFRFFRGDSDKGTDYIIAALFFFMPIITKLIEKIFEEYQ
ncbi:MAG: hypothetical protein U0L18_06130 [Acutalibacteraceae bacterium]|nr:hypothetical protein [Acutalibacteraceae bacterium]